MAKRTNKFQNEATRVLHRALARKKRLNKFPKIGASKQVERSYQKKLRGVLTTLETKINAKLIPRLDALTADFYRYHPALSRAKADGLSDNLSHKIEMDADDENTIVKIINDIKIEMGQAYTPEEIRAIAMQMGVEIADFNERVIVEGLKRVAGVDIFLSEPWLTQQLETFAIGNTNLIGDLFGDALDRVQQEVLGGMMQGLRWEEIADNIRDIVDPDDGTASSRADFIARDQVSKLNGQLTELRQTDLGIEKYIWRTSQDERVRDSHRSKEGNVYEWSSPPVETGNPGEDYNCRCTAEPYLEDLLGDQGESTLPVNDEPTGDENA